MTRPDTDTTTTGIRTALATITACWDLMLPDAPTATTAGTIGRHATTSTLPVPAHILDVRAQTLARMSGWVGVVIADRRLRTSVDRHDVHAMADLLATHADWLAAHDAAGDAAAELGHSARKCRAVADPAALRFAGVCQICGADLMGDGKVATCRQCKAVVDGQTQQATVAAAVRTRLLTAQEIVDLSPSLGHRLTHTQVHRWVARGQLVSKGTGPTGRALYSAADVCEQIARRYGDTRTTQGA